MGQIEWLQEVCDNYTPFTVLSAVLGGLHLLYLDGCRNKAVIDCSRREEAH